MYSNSNSLYSYAGCSLTKFHPHYKEQRSASLCYNIIMQIVHVHKSDMQNWASKRCEIAMQKTCQPSLIHLDCRKCTLLPVFDLSQPHRSYLKYNLHGHEKCCSKNVPGYPTPKIERMWIRHQTKS